MKKIWLGDLPHFVTIAVGNGVCHNIDQIIHSICNSVATDPGLSCDKAITVCKPDPCQV